MCVCPDKNSDDSDTRHRHPTRPFSRLHPRTLSSFRDARTLVDASHTSHPKRR